MGKHKKDFFTDWRPKMYALNKADQFVVGWLISQVPGVGRTDGRLVHALEEKLTLWEVGGWKRGEEGERKPYELTKIEVDWITEHIGKNFDAQKVPPAIAGIVQDLDDLLKVEPVKPEEPPKE